MLELLQTIALLCQINADSSVRNIKMEQNQCQKQIMECMEKSTKGDIRRLRDVHIFECNKKRVEG